MKETRKEKKIARDYANYLSILKGKVNTIDCSMKIRVRDVACQKCKGQLKQERSGSKRAKCESCGSLFQLLK